MKSLKPFTAARALVDLFADPNGTEHVFRVIDALEGPALENKIEALRKTPGGRRLLAERPAMVDYLLDHDRLRAMPEGSLAHAYLAFLEREKISADGLVDASAPVRRDTDTEEMAWLRSWLRDTHDLWHAVTGYEGDLIGEAALLAFSYVHGGNVGVAIIASLGWWKLGRVTGPSLRARALVAEGRARAKRARWFLDVPWHEWLARPLDEVRRDLDVSPLAPYATVRAHEVDTALAA